MKILLADDHDLVADAIVALLKSNDEELEIDAVRDLPMVFNNLRQSQDYDIIILDLRMPGMNGLTGAKKLMSAYPDIPVMILSGNLTYNDVQLSLDLGVKGLLTKNMTGAALVGAIRLVAAGDMYVPPSLMVQRRNIDNQEGGMRQLTGREIDVLSQLRHGSSNKEIANTLSIQESTVKLHLRSICEKFNAKNRTDIVIKAIDHGLA